MKTFKITLWNLEGEGCITVEVEAPNENSACQYVKDTMCWSYEEVEDDGDEN